ncbi:MAG: DUF4091 domain-containing protein [Kiritimatiellae bacterium]|nr:DUF4091 domain-containing protein [Kiritimatiellia bacterium]
MNVVCKMLFAAVVAAETLQSGALDLVAWKSETVNAFLPDGESVAAAKDGFEVKVGALKGVAYSQAPKIWRKETSNALDRVVWGDAAATSRVVQVKVPRDAKAGVHSFGDLRVKVLDRTITPVRERSYYLDLWQHPWAVARCSKTTPFSKEHYDAMRPLWTQLASLGQKVITTTIVRFPWSRQCCDGYETMVRHIKAEDGSWTFDYTIFDEYVEFALSCGLGPYIACYSICPWDEGRIWWDEPGKKNQTMRAKPGSKEYEDYWAPFLADFAKHLKEKGWFEYTTVAFDERGPDETKAAADLLRKVAPGLRLELSGNRAMSAFEGIDPDVYSQSMEHITKDFFADVAKRRAKGLKTTYYVCNSPLSPNTFVFSSPDEGYYLGLYPVVAGFDGFLRWAYNSWPPKPMENADYAGLFAGDTFLVYPDGSPSIRLLMLQNGLEAAEKYCQLMAAGECEDELDELAARFNAKESLWKKPGYFTAIREAADKVLNADAGKDGSTRQSAPPETPTMGWSSWNAYRVNISDKLIKKQADLLVELGLDKCGYKYVNIDDGYFGGRDENGRLKTHPERFPEGLKGVVEHIHGLGLKAGIYSDAGADTCGCFWDKDALGEGVGLYKHERQDAEYFFKELGFDFIKIDFCGGDKWQNKGKLSLNERDQYTKIRKAIDAVKPGVRINVCRWNYPGTWVHEIGSSWRISADINPTWGRVKAIIKENLYLSAYAAPGAYNDMDMLEVGRGFSDEEDQTHFAVWCMMSSPLLIGCDLEKLKSKPKTLALLKNKDLIALDQDTAAPQAYVVKKDGDTYVLLRELTPPDDGWTKASVALAFLNLSDEPKGMTFRGCGHLLGLDKGHVKVRDMIAGCDISDPGVEPMTVPPHAVRIYRLDSSGRREVSLYEAETAYLSTYQELHDAKKAKTGYYEKNDKASGGMAAANVGGRRGNYLAWNNVWSEKGGEYRMSVKTLGEGGEVKAKVNGVACGGTASGDGSGMVEFHISLNPGVNSVRLFNNEAALPLIDCMWINKIAK